MHTNTHTLMHSQIRIQIRIRQKSSYVGTLIAFALGCQVHFLVLSNLAACKVGLKFIAILMQVKYNIIMY